ncbi:MAG TPA: TetR family transcriptional regulator [Bryobacteraceae bacterium]|jgi:AcrR family transcriptional regulator|nr:TetR family transcriptional regulator [Bryobacteraceae bacterium]
MPISDCEILDPRIRRTRQLLQGALRTLMQTKSFDEIAVQDITELATVNRATFYDHYTDKYALLDAMAAGGFHMLLKERNVRYDGACPSAVRALILATCDYLTRSHSGSAACQRHSAFEPLIEAAITSAIRRVLMTGMPKGSSTAGPPPEMIATAASGAIYGAVKEWSKTPGHGSAEEVVPFILQLVLPILETAGPLESKHATLADV